MNVLGPRRSSILGLRWLLGIGVALALVVIVLGAYVRLSNAGLSCPDWPLCYGQLTAPDAPHEIAKAEAAFPGRPVDTGRGMKEMVHRYLASGLGLVIIAAAFVAFRSRRQRLATAALLGVVVLQGLLGMWTVTLLVHPAVVTAHLLGGMSTLGLSFWIYLRAADGGPRSVGRPARALARVLLVLVPLQIVLGGWVSTHYAALACTSLPGCLPGSFWPTGDLGEAFRVFRDLGVNYEYGVLGAGERGTIHMVHRSGALLVTLAALGFVAVARRDGALALAGRLVFGALVVQVAIGIGVVWLTLPLPLAVLHNGGAAVLLLAVVYANHASTPAAGRILV